VKSNLGHLEAAAGIAGLVKAALMVRNRVIPPSLHFAKPNPYIPFDDLSLRVAGIGQSWPAGDRPALVGVSAFGFGGTNAHLVVEQAPQARLDDDESDPRHQEQAQLLTISAQGEQALKDLAGRYEAQLTQPDAAVSAASLCRSAAVRRTHHERRLAIVGTTIDDLRQGLVDFRREQDRAGTSSGGRRVARRPAPVFVFSGQGPRWWPLSRDLLEGEPVFRQSIEESDELLRRDVDWSLLEQLTTEASSSRLGDTAVAQPALCALQIALASLWRSCGIEPAAVVGHSIGEVAAAQVAGVLSRPDALRIAVHRGRVIRAAIGQGRMAAAGVSFEQGQRILADLALPALSIAASNGPRSIVFAGETTALRALAGSLEADGVFCRVLESVDYASHSPQMDPLLGELRALLGEIKPGTATVAMISTVTGRSVDGTELDGSYWATNLRQPVLFDQVITELIGSGHDTFIELSPHPMLGDPIAERMDVEAADGVVVASLHRDQPGRAAILGELGRLYTAGFAVDWRKIYSRPNSADGSGSSTRAGAMVALPSYPWQRQRCWFDDDAAVARSRRRRVNNSGHPVLETSMRSAVEPRAQHWSAQIDLQGFPYLKDHRIEGTAVLPASLLLDAALAGARKLLADDSASLEDVRFTRMTVLGEPSNDTTFQLVLLPETSATGEFRIFTRDAGEPAGDWTPAADGRFRSARSVGGDEGPADSLAKARGRCPKPIDPAEYYSALSRAGLEYGPSFQGLEGVWSGDREAVGRLRPRADLTADLTADREPYLIHPALLDSCLQVLAAAIGPDLTRPAPTYLPVSVGGFTVDAGSVAVPRWAHATIGKGDPGDDEITGSAVSLFDDAGARVATLDGITLRRLAPSAAADPVADALLELRWRLVDGDAPRRPVPVDSWLLLADRDGVGQALGATIRAAGGHVVTVTAGQRYRRNTETDYEVNPARPEDFVALFAQLRDGGGASLTGVLHAWSLDPVAVGDHETDLPPRSDDDGGVSVLHLVQALAHERADDPPRLVLVTRGAQSVGSDAPAPDLAQASIWGLARVVMLEHRELRAKIIDLDPARPDDETDRLLEEIGRLDEADQLCLRSAGRYAAALEPWTAPIDADRPATRRPFDRDRDHNLRLLATHPGILDSLTSTVWQRRGPGPGQVEIEIAAAGLNFSDVLKALGICPGVPPGTVPLGAECAGTVTAVGEGVTTYGIGDPVMAVAPSSLAAFTTTEAQLVWPKPNALSDEQAAAVPIAFLTAIHGLEYLARLRAGEKVLIHSATGGVGLAALQVARRNGAEIFATAGTEPKRALLRSLGVKHVMDSRSLRFADEILELTGGRGVDVVLNSLAGEALTRSLGLLAPNGRFVEIGKQDVYSNSHVGLGALKHNRSFFAVDLERSFLEQPDLIARLFRELGRGFENGDFTALPVTGFAYSQADEAFGLMAQARHTGKIVLHPDGCETVVTEAGAPGVKADATYLITGGLGALGLQTARYLAGQGARHLALVGRNGPSAEAEPILAELGSGPAEIRVFSADVSQPQEVAHLLAEIDDSMPALAGIVHAAGTLDDGLLQQLDRARFRSVAAAKVAGAWHLHRASLERDLDFFVMYSSAAGLLGSPGQGNYAAANAFLDSLAGYRHAHGLPALSIDWGPWSQVGLAAGPERGGALSGVGIASLSVADGIEALNRVLTTSSSQVCVLPLDRDRLRIAADTGLLPGLLGRLIGPAPTNTEPGPSGAGAVRRDLLAVEPGRRRSAILMTHCRAEAGRVLKLDPAQIDPTAPLAGMGFDSLMSLELRRRLERSLHLELPATVAWRFPTIEALVPFLAERMGITLTTPKAGPARPTEPIETGRSTSDDDDLERLTDGEIESLLLAKITHFDEGGRG
jgi:polyketide synthase 12